MAKNKYSQSYLPIEEYIREGNSPVKIKLDDIELIVPASYKGDREAFLDDLFSFQDKEYRKYEKHNKKNPQDEIDVEGIKYSYKRKSNDPKDILDCEIHLIVPFDLAKRQRGRKNKKSEKEITGEIFKRAVKRYNKALEKTISVNEKYPNTPPISFSVSSKHISMCTTKEVLYATGQVCKGLGKALKWTSKQAADIAIGITGSPIALAYKFISKDPKATTSSKKNVIEEKLIPAVRKGLMKTLCVAAIACSIEGVKLAKNYKEKKEIKKELMAERDNFFSEYNTTNASFFENYKTVKEHESELICLLACSENFASKSYLCQANEWTIGYGSRYLADGTKVREGMTITKEGAVAAVQRHLNKYVYPQLEHINKPLSLNQLTAVCSFIYNTDEREFKNSSVCRTINANGSDDEVREAFSMFRSVNGKRSYGLINANGLRGYLYGSSKNIMEILTLDSSFMGSPDIKCYIMKDSRNPKENENGSFVLREIDDVKKDFDKFKTNDIDATPLNKLPKSMRDELISEYSVQLNDNNTSLTYKSPQGSNKQISILSFVKNSGNVKS